MVHTMTCGVGVRLLEEQPNVACAVEWAAEVARAFNAAVVVTVRTAKVWLPRSEYSLPAVEADIRQVETT